MLGEFKEAAVHASGMVERFTFTAVTKAAGFGSWGWSCWEAAEWWGMITAAGIRHVGLCACMGVTAAVGLS